MTAPAISVRRPNALTEREKAIFDLIATGITLKAIGMRLCLKPSTISAYRSRILRKLHCTNNAELVRLAAGLPARAP